MSFIAQRPVIFSICSGYREPWTVIFEAALSISRKSSGVSSTATDPIFSSRRANFVVPGSEQPWLLRKQPSQRDLSRCCLLPLCDLAKEVNQGLVRFDCLRCKARENAAEIRAAELS